MTVNNNGLEGQYTITYPQLNPFQPVRKETVEGAQVIEKVRDYMDSLPRILIALRSCIFRTPCLKISRGDPGIYEVIMRFRTRILDVFLDVRGSQADSLIRFFRPRSYRMSIETYDLLLPPLEEHLHLSPNLKKIVFMFIQNLDKVGLINMMRHMPALRELRLFHCTRFSQEEFKRCLSSTGTIEFLTLGIDHPFDESVLREARHGRLKELEIEFLMPARNQALSIEEAEKAMHAVPTLKRLRTDIYYDDDDFNFDKGFEYKNNRWVALSGNETEELENIEQSKTAVLKHAPNLNTVEIDLLTLPAFQSVKVLHITGDYFY